MAQKASKLKEEIVDPSKLVELRALADAMTGTLKAYVPDASVNLDWLSTEGFELPMPKAEVKLVEDGSASTVGHIGHGLQRAFILTILQHLAVAQAPRLEGVDEQQTEAGVISEPESEDVKKQWGLKMPNLILGIEEPELDQHPNRQRHLSKIGYTRFKPYVARPRGI